VDLGLLVQVRLAIQVVIVLEGAAALEGLQLVTQQHETVRLGVLVEHC
jgi:hypothetical protein